MHPEVCQLKLPETTKAKLINVIRLYSTPDVPPQVATDANDIRMLVSLSNANIINFTFKRLSPSRFILKLATQC
jgi:hypothetical protein